MLERKAELLRDIEGYEKEEADAHRMFARAVSLRGIATGAGESDQAAVYARVMGVAQKSIDTAKSSITDDRQRVEALDRALRWPEPIFFTAVATLVRGRVMVKGAGGTRQLDPKLPVSIGEHILLAGDALLELQLGDGSTMHLGPNTDFLYERDVQGIYYQILGGELHKTVIIGVRGATDQPTYRGPRCVVAVRGTEFTLQADESNETLMVLHGEIEVDPGGGRSKVMLTAGQGLTIPKSGPVGSVLPLDPASIVKWWEK